MAATEVSAQDLFTRLAEGSAAGVTVVTPNHRLAQALAGEFDRAQAAKGLVAWETADILPVDAFIQRFYEDALYADRAEGLPRLLSPAQERAIWESVLAGAPLLSVAETAADCAKAWRLAHAWRIDGALEKFPGNDDTRAFVAWARAYAKRCTAGNLTDGARLADLREKIVHKKPGQVVAYGFDILPPQTREFLGAFDVVSCRPEVKRAAAKKTPFPSARQELEAAAQWARARLEAGAKRIGVVVPDLQQRRKQVVRVFSNAMRPGWNLPGMEHGAMPFDISIGEPLGEFPVVAAALGILEFSGGEIPFEKATQLIRSPFLRGAEMESAARALLDAQLRRKLPARLTLPKLIGMIGEHLSLRSSLESVFRKSRETEGKTLSAHGWAQHYTALLEAAGFPGERTPDSAEFQARAKFNELLGELSRLSLLSEKITNREALRQLRRLCAETLFQPETPDAPVLVLGILESAGLAFDCLWVSGLAEEAWPLAARANPFLPVALQKKAGIPEAAAETSLALDRRITAGWLGAAGEVVFSYPQKEKDRDLLPSPLIAQVPEGKIERPALPNHRDVLFRSRAVEILEDGKARPITAKTVRGGTRVLADQAACPFRAFARHRLGAELLEVPAQGPDAMQRGRLLHALMAGIWRELKTQEGLEGDVSRVVSGAAENAVREQNIEGRFAELEKQRLIRLAGEWLELERTRPPFEIAHIEQERKMEIGGLSLNGRIDRMDRMAGGGNALIDYKAGNRVTPNDWQGPRPDEPQLPLYAVTAPEPVSAVAFAKLKTGDMKFAGFSMNEKEMPGLKQSPSWSGLIATWKNELENLAAGFAEGDARVDPKRGLASCTYCGLQPLCRVHERLDALAEGGEDQE